MPKISALTSGGAAQAADLVAVARKTSPGVFVSRNLTAAAIAALGGMTLLASGTIASPTSLVELALPAGYDKFHLECVGVQLDGNDNLCIRVSFDDGANYETGDYIHVWNDTNYTPGFGGANNVSSGFTDAMFNIGFNGHNVTANPGFASVDITPGSASTKFSSRFNSNSFLGANLHVCDGYCYYDTVGAVNKIEVGPYFGDGVNWIGGSYFLWGVPTP
jgi:hypothetical protein